MKNLLWAVVVIIIAGAFLMMHRYSVIIHSPIVARIDNLTGKVWIVNSGVWCQVQDNLPNGALQEQKAVIPAVKKGK